MNKLLPAILLIVLLASCHKESTKSQKQNLFINDPSTVNVTFDDSHPGNPISSDFEGLSFENEILAKDASFLNPNNKVVIQLLKNLGPGMLRMGGGSSNLVTWVNAERNSNTSLDVITTTDIDNLSAFSKATGWSVLFGLNLAQYDPKLAADEAAYVSKSLGNNLYAFQSGNEPDAFAPYNHLRNPNYSYNDFLGEWRSYQAAVKNAVPEVKFAGPDIVVSTDWITAFADSEGSDIILLDGHYYETGPATDISITYRSILGGTSKTTSLIQSFKETNASKKIPFRITECNNIYGGGKPGVSDVFASALWALDFMWTVADSDGKGINFHTGTGLSYSPIVNINNVFSVKPEYYAMLAFKYASNGNAIPTTIDKPDYCSAHTCQTSNGYALTLINKNTEKAFNFNIVPGKRISSIKVARLNAPSITSTDGTKFAGSSVNADGTFNASTFESYTINKDSFIVSVPAGSAAVVTTE